MLHPVRSVPSTLRWFQFQGSLRRPDSREVEPFRSGLLGALRAARGLSLPLAIAWNCGRTCGIELGVASPQGESWWERTGARLYSGSRWVRELRPGHATWTGSPRFGALSTGGLLPALLTDRGVPWSESAVRALRHLPRPIRVVWEIFPAPDRAHRPPHAPAIEPREVPAGFRLGPITAPERELRDSLETRARSLVWRTSLRLEYRGEVTDADLAAVERVLSVTGAGPAGASLTWASAIPWMRRSPPHFLLSDAECAALFPEPWSQFGAGGGSLDAAARNLLVGFASDGSALHVTLPPSEGRHLMLLGQTGMGKSTALVQLSLAAIARASVVLFDPIGDTARAFIDQLPKSAIDRLLWISPSESPLSVNALEPLRDERRGHVFQEKARGDLVGALRRVRLFRYAETAFWGPRIEEMLGRALAAAALYPEGTLVEAERLLSGVGGRTLSGIPPEARAAVETLEGLVRSRPEEVDGARRLLGEVTHHGVLRSMLCDPAATVAPSTLVRPAGLTVLSGDAPLVGEAAARYLLAVYLALVWDELLARPAGPKTVLVLDEAQWYAHDTASEILRLGRRSNVHLWMATQSLGALAEPVREAALTNASDFLVFRGSPDDAREFARWRSDLNAHEILSLDRGEAMLLAGKGQEVHRVRIRPPFAGDSSGERRRQARLASRATSRISDAPVPSAPPLVSEGDGELDLMDVIAAALAATPAAASVSIPFAILRELFDPGGTRIRSLGGQLSRCGALRDRRAGQDSRIWIVSRREFVAAHRPRGIDAAPDAARAAWEQVRRRAAELGQYF